MNARLILAVAILFVLASAAGLYYFFKPSTPIDLDGNVSVFPTTTEPSNQPTSSTGSGGTPPSVPVAAEKTATLKTITGRSIAVQPFLPATSLNVASSTLSLLSQETADMSYDLLYYPNGSFGIVLLKEPLAAARTVAEQDLLARLGITEDDACQLNYRVVVAPWVNPLYTGENIGFSFCIRSVRL